MNVVRNSKQSGSLNAFSISFCSLRGTHLLSHFSRQVYRSQACRVVQVELPKHSWLSNSWKSIAVLEESFTRHGKSSSFPDQCRGVTKPAEEKHNRSHKTMWYNVTRIHETSNDCSRSKTDDKPWSLIWISQTFLVTTFYSTTCYSWLVFLICHWMQASTAFQAIFFA